MRSNVEISKLPDEYVQETKQLIWNYVRWVGVDLNFQHIDAELAQFPEAYREPFGAFFIAKAAQQIVGCVGMKNIGAGVCEMKRLYVDDHYKGLGIGKKLVEVVIAEARTKGYITMKLDTLAWMTAAQQLYRSMGFYETEPYTHNPIPGTVFMAKDLTAED